MNGSARSGWADVGITLGGAIYTGGLLGYAPYLITIPERSGHGPGMAWVMFVILGTAACDTGAYLVGSRFGKHKLIPHISPAKTWEGLFGGVMGGIVAAIVFSGLFHFSIFLSVLLGLVVCAAAVSGDLCESMLKRAAGVKDSGTLIPGHGGALDRLDSILFVMIAIYWFTIIVS
jgi:phosphatidate cytidylyltransferase